MEIYMQFDRNHIDKLDFIEAYKPVHSAAFSTSNIYNEFAVIGLILYDL